MIMLLVILANMQFSISMKISCYVIFRSNSKILQEKGNGDLFSFPFLVQNVPVQGCFKISNFEPGIHVLS